MSEDLTTWADRLESVIHSNDLQVVRRVAVFAETGSTQDTARELGEPGVVVIAGRQKTGRGRLGRSWAPTADRGLAATFVLESSSNRDSGRLALASGLGASRAIEPMCPTAIGLRWPNDVVERAGGRKLCGILIERTPSLTCIGIGINVDQRDDDWDDALRSRCASIRQLGGDTSRIEVAEGLLVELDTALQLDDETLASEWNRRDVLLGTHRTFVCEGLRLSGAIEAVTSTGDVALRTSDGIRLLPAGLTSLEHS